MGWIKPPEPDDNEVLITTEDGKTWTWGEHRKMEEWLKELEATDPVVKKARESLDDKLAQAGVNPGIEVILICEHCGVEQFTIHKPSCPTDDPLGREAGGYQYLDELFVPVWTTSIPRTDEFALAMFKNIQMMHEDRNVVYITRRDMHASKYKLMPFKFDRTLGEEGEVIPYE